MASVHSNSHPQYDTEDADRTNRFLSEHGTDMPNSLRERAASQPPRTTNQGFLSSPMQPMRNTSAGIWPRLSGLNPNNINGALPQSVPTRSASFSTSPPTSLKFQSTMRGERFASTFEDDESEALSDAQDPYDRYDDYVQSSLSGSRGRTYAADLTRSRSQSLATTRPGAIGSGLPHGSSGLWNESSFSNSKNIQTPRYNELKPSGTSRYGSLGALGRSASSGYGSITDPSNMSPFVRDVSQIVLDEDSVYRNLWSGMHTSRDENGGGGSGTTSRRHSVSVVQPRRPTIVGFNVPGGDGPEESSRPGPFHPSYAGGGGLHLTDDDLAVDLNMLSLRDDPRPSASAMPPPSQPSSLPNYAALSRSPPAPDRLSPYQPLHLNIPGGASYAGRQPVGSPSDSALSGGSPSRALEDALAGARHGVAARYVPGQGIQHIPEQSVLQGPLSPVGVRAAHYAPAQQIQRRPSDAGKALNDLGKGVPLHAVPTSWPLYIIEFKAGRTDLFYCTDLALDIRVGDLVIVEADRGKDLGKVINDTITLAEVDAFQKQQKLINAGYADQHGVPTSPTAGGGNAKEISPKMIYGKAQPQDTQHLTQKLSDETKALELCRSKVRQRRLPMEVVDAEYQWDRRKLTFYFVAEKRIDFRELVRELFRLYKTRIWMASLSGPGGIDQ
ncbi:PSP1-domain-containing protein [Wolfiporia cocos MD-104 SS10]|uniref:PSP1-domain-containing protein n=1 Tax=Wolfiporia cocos (strain MD-104) TaxID=742152 RepID=A0A2H3J384_WOLCO|nr:PSP1-domain-containing protein [Wolfiporia cocos MD-104 SS10]